MSNIVDLLVEVYISVRYGQPKCHIQDKSEGSSVPKPLKCELITLLDRLHVYFSLFICVCLAGILADWLTCWTALSVKFPYWKELK